MNYKIGNEKLCKLTDNAVKKLLSLFEKSGKKALRIKVIGGGCSGLQYLMDLVDGPLDRDILIPREDGANVIVDPKSALFVSGSEMDYSDALQSAGFKVRNPVATAHCSCGESFSA